MNNSELEIRRQKERTLRAAWMLSAWGPFTVLYAALVGRSTVLFADLLRRSTKFLALFLAWLVFRRLYITANNTSPSYRAKLENLTQFAVGAAMLVSFVFIVLQSIQRIIYPQPVGFVLPGLVIAFMGLGVNGWFWHRNHYYTQLSSSPLIESQLWLYRAKTLIDLTIILMLSLSLMLYEYSWSLFFDPAGSILIACFLGYSGGRTVQLSVQSLLNQVS